MHPVGFHFQYFRKPFCTFATADPHLHNTGYNNKLRVYLSKKRENTVQGETVELWPVEGLVSSALHVICPYMCLL